MSSVQWTTASSHDFAFLQMQQWLELVCPYFRNVRIATFSVQARAKEVAEHLDKDCQTLLKNYRPDPITGQKPVKNSVFARELLVQQGSTLPSTISMSMHTGS